MWVRQILNLQGQFAVCYTGCCTGIGIGMHVYVCCLGGSYRSATYLKQLQLIILLPLKYTKFASDSESFSAL